MRMWMVDPSILCRKHLLGEHGEIHKHRHNFVKKHRINNRIYPIVQIEPSSMEKRHDELAKEMIRRGFNHQSPFEQPDISYLPLDQQNAKVDINNSIQDLKTRCPECAKNIKHKL
jgi:uracil-DNA glycosylase